MECLSGNSIGGRGRGKCRCDSGSRIAWMIGRHRGTGSHHTCPFIVLADSALPFKKRAAKGCCGDCLPFPVCIAGSPVCVVPQAVVPSLSPLAILVRQCISLSLSLVPVTHNLSESRRRDRAECVLFSCPYKGKGGGENDEARSRS